MPKPPIDPPPPHSQPDGELPAHLLRKLKITIPGYKLQSVIGRGGQAIVFQAVQQSTGQTVAIKLLREGRLADATARERLNREVAVLATLDHPNIVGIIDRGLTPDGYDYLVMNFIVGQSLKAYLEENSIAKSTEDPAIWNTDPAAVLRLFCKICAAVGFAHQRGIVHRDLCPANILVDNHGQPRILDFGLARATNGSLRADNDRRLSVTGQFLGKLAYASPEQARGQTQEINPATDVYALGVILYEILTGEYPYRVVGSIAEVLNNIIYSAPTPPSELISARDAQRIQAGQVLRRQHSPIVNPAIEAIVLKALAKNAAERYQSAGELGQDVESYLSGQPTVARLPESSVATDKSTRPNSRIGQFAIVTAVALFVAIGWAIFRFKNSDTPSPTIATDPSKPLPTHSQSAPPGISGPSETPAAADAQPQEQQPRDRADKPADPLQPGTMWKGYGRGGGLLQLDVLTRNGHTFTGRLTLPGQRGGNFFVEGRLRDREIHWTCKYSSLSEFAGTLDGNELNVQPIRYYETRGPVTLQLQD